MTTTTTTTTTPPTPTPTHDIHIVCNNIAWCALIVHLVGEGPPVQWIHDSKLLLLFLHYNDSNNDDDDDDNDDDNDDDDDDDDDDDYDDIQEIKTILWVEIDCMLGNYMMFWSWDRSFKKNSKCVLKEIWLCFERNQIVFWKKSIVFWQRLSTLLMLGRRASVGIYGGNLSWIFTSNGAKISAQIFIDIYINVDIRGRCKKKGKKTNKC